MPAPVIVLPSSVISKIRRGWREGGSVARTRQRCTPPHAHAAILQAALASCKMAAGAHAASGPRPACPSRLPSTRPEVAEEQRQPSHRTTGKKGPWEQDSRHGGPVCSRGLASGHLSPGPAHSAEALGAQHFHSFYPAPPNWKNQNTLLLHKAAHIAQGLLVAMEAAAPLPWLPPQTRTVREERQG